MKTAKKPGRPAGQSRSEIQVVGYLTRAEMERQLNALVSDGKIGHWWGVQHEPDEDCKKAHWHVRLVPPPSRAVVWAEILDAVSEMVPGETLPRKLVAGSHAVNDAGLDGLLYARHDRRYCDRKGLTKATYDYPREAFCTDCADWLDNLWSQSDNYEIPAKRTSLEDVIAEVERNPWLSDLALLRTCLVSGINKGQYDMLREYRLMLRKGEARADMDKARNNARTATATAQGQFELSGLEHQNLDEVSHGTRDEGSARVRTRIDADVPGKGNLPGAVADAVSAVFGPNVAVEQN